jgi:hypothetical protein
MLSQPVPVESLQNLIYLGQGGFRRPTDQLGAGLAFGARRAARARRAVVFGAQHDDGAHFVARLEPAQPDPELTADLWVNVC